MKKLIGLMLALVIGIVILTPTTSVDAQVLARRCCDTGGYVRCVLVNVVPFGSDCFCPGQGWGFAC